LDTRRSQPLADFHAVDVRQTEVGYDQGGLGHNRLVEPSFAVSRQDGAKPFPLEQNADRVTEAFIVVNYKYCVHRHGKFTALAGWSDSTRG
jgi:hypothetical protein